MSLAQKHRHRRDSYLLAHKLTYEPSLTYDNAWGQGGKIAMWAKVYQGDVKDRELIFANDKGEVMAMPYTTRFSKEYQLRTKAKLDELMKYPTDSMFLTLTIDPNKFHSLRGAYRGIRDGVTKLIHSARMRMLRGSTVFKGWNGQFAYTVEMQKNGSPHVHIALIGCTWIDLEWTRHKWTEVYNLGKQIRAVIVWARYGIARYLMKYILKGGSWTTTLLWALNARAFNRSRAILDQGKDQIAQIKATVWYYVGSFPIGAIKTYADLVSAMERG